MVFRACVDRQKEEHLKQEHQRALDNLAADQARDAQDMVTQFNSAQALLKDKISQLQIMWVTLSRLDE